MPLVCHPAVVRHPADPVQLISYKLPSLSELQDIGAPHGQHTESELQDISALLGQHTEPFQSDWQQLSQPCQSHTWSQ
jgi:hypothetical protein